jgi:hypothetical protein
MLCAPAVAVRANIQSADIGAGSWLVDMDGNLRDGGAWADITIAA